MVMPTFYLTLVLKKEGFSKFDNPQIKVKARIISSNAHKRSQFSFCKEAKTVV
jgi:hypothetical protein